MWLRFSHIRLSNTVIRALQERIASKEGDDLGGKPPIRWTGF